MRLVGIAIIVLAGAVMAAGGEMAESLPEVKRSSSVDDFGLLVAAAGILLFGAELFQWPAGYVQRVGSSTPHETTTYSTVP
jgi:hypothetical protein